MEYGCMYGNQYRNGRASRVKVVETVIARVTSTRAESSKVSAPGNSISALKSGREAIVGETL